MEKLGLIFYARFTSSNNYFFVNTCSSSTFLSGVVHHVTVTVAVIQESPPVEQPHDEKVIKRAYLLLQFVSFDLPQTGMAFLLQGVVGFISV